MKTFLKSIWDKLATPWRRANKTERIMFVALYYGFAMIFVGVIASSVKYSAPGVLTGLASGVILVFLGYAWKQVSELARRRGILEESNEGWARERAEEDEALGEAAKKALEEAEEAGEQPEPISKLNEVREIERPQASLTDWQKQE